MGTLIVIIIFGIIFIGLPILVTKENAKNNQNLQNANEETQEEKDGETQEENNENENVVKDTSPLVPIDPMYLRNEKLLIRNMVKSEIESQGENSRKLSTSKLNIKRNLLLGLVGILTFIYTIMYFFNTSLASCIFFEIVTIIVYFMIAKRFNIINVISKQAKKNPDEDIASIVSDVRNNKKDVIVPNIIKLSVAMFIAVLIPMIIFIKPKMIYIEYGDGYAFAKYTRGIIPSETDDIVIPETYEGKKVVAIGEKAFKNTNIKSISLPKTITSIKAYAFYGCNRLQSIDIPENVTEIRASAFENCYNLRTINLHEGIVDIRASAFKYTKISSIDLPDSLEYLGASVFSHCSALTEITIPRKVIELNGQTFEYCTSLRTINLHDNIISIHGENFIGDRNLNNVVLPSKITEIRGNTFEYCSSLTLIIIPEGVTRIGGHAFYGCSSLSYVSIPSTLREIGSSAFRQCSSLRSISIPRTTLVNERAFKESPTIINYQY